MALFWLSDEAWAPVEPHLPKNQPGARRVDDRRVISGIFHVLKSGCRWGDCPVEYGPPTTIYNRFDMWSTRGFWLKLLDALVDAGAVTRSNAIDSKGYDADPLRRSLRQASAVPVIPGRSNRKRQLRYDRERYRGRRLIENAFCRLEDFQRVARCDKLARNYPSGVAGAVALAFWM